MSKNTTINSRLGSSTVTAETVNGYIKITVASNGNPVTQYYVAKNGDPTIYMGTYIIGEIDPKRKISRILISCTNCHRYHANEAPINPRTCAASREYVRGPRNTCPIPPRNYDARHRIALQELNSRK